MNDTIVLINKLYTQYYSFNLGLIGKLLRNFNDGKFLNPPMCRENIAAIAIIKTANKFRGRDKKNMEVLEHYMNRMVAKKCKRYSMVRNRERYLPALLKNERRDYVISCLTGRGRNYICLKRNFLKTWLEAIKLFSEGKSSAERRRILNIPPFVILTYIIENKSASNNIYPVRNTTTNYKGSYMNR